MAKYLVKKLMDAGVLVGYQIMQKTDAKNLPRGENFIFAEGVDTKYPSVSIDIDGNITIIEDANKRILEAAYNQLNIDIAQDGASIFKTANIESMIAYTCEYLFKIISPELFVSSGLVTSVITPSFPTIGTSLNSAALIRTYHQEVLFDLATKRESKISQYVTLKSQLGF